MNAPNRYELFVLEDGDKSVEVTEDTKIPNAATFKILKQDHTLGNLIRAQLLTMPQVLFAGYKLPHPLNPHFLLKLQTDGSAPPAAVLEQACTRVIAAIATLEAKFRREFVLRGVEREGAGGAGASAQGVGPIGGRMEDAYGVVGPAGGWQESGDYADF